MRIVGQASDDIQKNDCIEARRVLVILGICNF